MISNKDLDFFVKNNYNVIFRGKHGVGKTSIILDTFKKHGLNYKMFSASTMDPWVDFVGIPKEKITEDGVPYLDLIRPLEFQRDEIQAIFMDEYNRANHKVRNACMELIQFKSINGKKFNNLKMIWVAINPKEDGDDVYDVEELDPAQKDRFHAVIDLPYIPDKKYFITKYPEVGELAVAWWNSLNKDHKNKVSPRRLDYLVEIYLKGGNISYLVDDGVNLKSFSTKMNESTIKKVFNDAITYKKIEDITKIISTPMYYDVLEGDILANLDIFFKYIPQEKIVTYLNNGIDKVISYIKLNMEENIDFVTIYINNSKNTKKTITELTNLYKQIYSKLNSTNSNIAPKMSSTVYQSISNSVNLIQSFNTQLDNCKSNGTIGVASATTRRDIFYDYIKVDHEIDNSPDKHRLLSNMMNILITPSNVSTFELRYHFNKLIASSDTELDDVKQYIKNCSNVLRYMKANFIFKSDNILDVKLIRLIKHFDNALDVIVLDNKIITKDKLYKHLSRMSSKFRIESISAAKNTNIINSTIEENDEDDNESYDSDDNLDYGDDI